MLQIQSNRAQFVMMSQEVSLEIILNLLKIFESDDRRSELARVGGSEHKNRELENKEMECRKINKPLAYIIDGLQINMSRVTITYTK